MKVLVVSNYYPPDSIGGYEQACKDVVVRLRQAGHEVVVLTSQSEAGSPANDVQVYRWLDRTPVDLSMGWLRNVVGLARKEWRNQRLFQRAAREFHPDVVSIWNPVGVSVSLGLKAHRLGTSVKYFVLDHWWEELHKDPWFALWHRSLRRRGWDRLRATFAQWINVLVTIPEPEDLPSGDIRFCSASLRNSARLGGRSVVESAVIPLGVDLELFAFKSGRRSRGRLLFVGQIVEHKSLHTVIDALKLLRGEPRFQEMTLTVVGPVVGRSYAETIRLRITELGLESAVEFRDPVPREHLSEIYHQHDILVFPSQWEEPFGLVLVEAMSSGVVAVCSRSGATTEIAEHNDSALFFDKKNASECAREIRRLVEDDALYHRIQANARKRVEEQFTLERMVGSLTEHLGIPAGVTAHG